jgi:YegS/Rv2252/BmrU family lipid kinase
MGNKVKFIYNPYSGENSILTEIDIVLRTYQKNGYSVVPYRLDKEYGKADDAFFDIEENYDHVLIAGGDGTVDIVINSMKKNHVDIPVGILPSGTANDFAKFIGMPSNIEAACEQIINSEVKSVDLGKVNNEYFVNVASTGLFTDISQKTDVNLKNTIGKLAYYLKGIEQIPSFRNLKVRVSSNENAFDGDMYLMLVFNGQTAGNINFAYKAMIDDGLLDVIIIKASAPIDIINLLLSMLKGEHLEGCPGLIYFKTDKLLIESTEDIVTDIDGERGPDFPLEISCMKNELKIKGAV